MAEVFGIVASSLTVAEVAAKAGGTILKLKRLWNEIQNVPETINDLMKQIDILDPLIWEMETEINQQRASINPILFNDTALRKSTEYCREAMKDLTRLVDDLSVHIDSEKKLKRRLGKIKVVLKAQVIAECEKRLGRAIAFLNVAQQSYLTALMKLQPHVIVQQLKNAQIQPNYQLLDASEQNEEPTYPAVARFVENEACDNEPKQKPRAGIKSTTSAVIRRSQTDFGSYTFFGTIAARKTDIVDPTTSFTEKCFDIRVQIPRWIASKVWDIQLTKATSGWSTHLRTWCIVDYKLSPAFQAVRRGDAERLRSLFRDGLASPFECNEYGCTLLHFAADIDCIRLLLHSGLDMVENCNINCIPTVALMLYAISFLGMDYGMKSNAIESYRFVISQQILDFSDIKSNVGSTLIYAPACYLFQQYSDFVSSSSPPYLYLLEPHYETPFKYRLHSIVSSVAVSKVPIPAKALYHYLWPGGVIQVEDLRKLEQFDKPLLNLVAFTIGNMGKNDERPILLEWKEILQETLCVSNEMHSIYHWSENGEGYQLGYYLVREGTPLIDYIIGRITRYFDPCIRLTLRQSRIQAALLEWVSLLKECQIDLMEYGQEERKILMDNYIINSRRLGDYFQDHLGEVVEVTLPKLRDIRYGANPEDWYLVLDMDVEELAGEFWDMVETPRFPMPGGWIDD